MPTTSLKSTGLEEAQQPDGCHIAQEGHGGIDKYSHSRSKIVEAETAHIFGEFTVYGKRLVPTVFTEHE